MARKDLLSEAIADAKAVKETAMANAKLALEEAFTPKLQSMISAKLAEEADDEEVDETYEGEETEESYHEEEEVSEEEDMDEEDEMEMDSEEEEMEMDLDSDDSEEEDMEVSEEEDMDADEDDLDLESIIAELEAEMDEEEDMDSEEEDMEVSEEEDMEVSEEEEEIDLDEVIRTLKEMEHDEEEAMTEAEEDMDEEEDSTEELEEAYRTIESLRGTINEVNLLNAKLLYTNKLFRTFDLNEGQKVKVLENFDRTSSVREVKLVFSTLAENLNVAKKTKVVVKEGYASKATKSSAPKKKIISEGNELAARWKKLAGLI